MKLSALFTSLVVLALCTPVDGGDPEFLRGDANGDGRVVALGDAYFLLAYAFTNGDVPPCMAAADVDGNDAAFALLDTLYLLNWAFNGGEEPPDPGPEECGPDPGLEVGCDTPPDPCPGDDPGLEPDEDYVLSISNITADETDDEATVTIYLDNSGDDLIGYQFGVCHDDILFIDDVDDDVAQGSAIEDTTFTFESIVGVDGGFTVGALFNVITGENLESSDEELELYDVTYSIDGVGLAVLDFCDTAGDPAVSPRVFTTDAEILPETENGSINIDPGDADYLIFVSNEVGAKDDIATVSVLLTNEGSAIEGFQFGVCHDDLVAIESDDDVEAGEALDGLDLTFEAITVYDDHWNVGAVFDPDETLDTGLNLELYLATYDLLDEGTSILEICADDLDPAVVVVVVDSVDIFPFREAGSIEITANPNGEFLRGDMDANGVTFPLVDAIFLLKWAFNSDDAPPCMDAADANDNGSVFAIIDAIYLLEYGFNNTAAPPDPGPNTCGIDPTDDDTDCLEPPDSCL